MEAARAHDPQSAPETPGPSPQGLESSVSEGLGAAVVGPDPQTCLQSPWAGEPSFPHNPHDFSYFQETCSLSSLLGSREHSLIALSGLGG